MITQMVNITPDAEESIVYMARVSNPSNQDNKNISGLINYCIKHKHWSIFEMATMTVEIECSRAIARQILRHRSFSFQEFSQRYAEVTDGPILSEVRMQDTKNRQNSIPTDDEAVAHLFHSAQMELWSKAVELYHRCIKSGIAKEQARVLLPEGMTPTRMYMSGNIRSWIHYLDLRCDKSTQKEHRAVAESIKVMFKEELPFVAQAMGWNEL